MGFETITGTDATYGLISFDSEGRERAEDGGLMSERIIERVAASKATNVFFFCHGWKGDVPAAKDQYNRWIGALVRSPDLQRAAAVFPDFSPLFIGLHWPSEPWGDEELRSGSFGISGAFAGNGSNPAEQMLQAYLDRLGDSPEIRGPLQVIIEEARRNAGATELSEELRAAYLALNEALKLGSDGVAAAPDADREGFDPEDGFEGGGAASFGGIDLGGVLGPLRQLSYWTMKKRARSIGEGAMHEFLKKLQQATAERGTRIHLMGHSFGTIVVSSMTGGPNASGALSRPIDSLVLVQGAVSLWSYAAKIPFRGATAGYFHKVLVDGKLRGPLVVTRSKYDKAVGVLYPFASKLHGSTDFDLDSNGLQLPKYGAIGAFGIQGTPDGEAQNLTMLDVDGHYSFTPKRIYNLESSRFIAHGDGLSGAHSDIDGPQVAHAIWEAAFAAV
jgi:hypothetical protein